MAHKKEEQALEEFVEGRVAWEESARAAGAHFEYRVEEVDVGQDELQEKIDDVVKLGWTLKQVVSASSDGPVLFAIFEREFDEDEFDGDSELGPAE